MIDTSLKTKEELAEQLTNDYREALEQRDWKRLEHFIYTFIQYNIPIAGVLETIHSVGAIDALKKLKE